MNKQELIPLVGFGKVRFGMTIKQVTAILGQPDDKQENVQYGEEDDDVSTDLYYAALGLTLSFSKTEGDRLVDIMTEDDTCPFFVGSDKIVIGADRKAVIDAALAADFGPYEETTADDIDDAEDAKYYREENLIDVAFEEMSLTFYFKNNKLDTIQLGPEIDDETDEIIWPED